MRTVQTVLRGWEAGARAPGAAGRGRGQDPVRPPRRLRTNTGAGALRAGQPVVEPTARPVLGRVLAGADRWRGHRRQPPAPGTETDHRRPRRPGGGEAPRSPVSARCPPPPPPHPAPPGPHVPLLPPAPGPRRPEPAGPAELRAPSSGRCAGRWAGRRRGGAPALSGPETPRRSPRARSPCRPRRGRAAQTWPSGARATRAGSWRSGRTAPT